MPDKYDDFLTSEAISKEIGEEWLKELKFKLDLATRHAASDEFPAENEVLQMWQGLTGSIREYDENKVLDLDETFENVEQAFSLTGLMISSLVVAMARQTVLNNERLVAYFHEHYSS